MTLPKTNRRAIAIFVITLLSAGDALADEPFAVLVVDTGRQGDIEALAERVEADLLSRPRVTLVDDLTARQSLEVAYELFENISLDWVRSVVQQGEEAYLQMTYDEAIELLTREVLVDSRQAITDLSFNPELALLIRRGIMALARTYTYSDQPAQADEAFLESLRLFPLWEATTDWYQPEIVERYEQLQAELLEDVGELVIETPDEDCTVTLNGLEVGDENPLRLNVPDGQYAVRAACGEYESHPRLVTVDGEVPAEVWISPYFDAHFDGMALTVQARPASDSDLDHLAVLGRAYGELVAPATVITVGLKLDHRLDVVLELAEIQPDGLFGGAVRLQRQNDGTFAVEDGLAVLLDGEVRDGVWVRAGGAWVEADTLGGGGMGPWPYVTLGAGLAGLAVGVIFTVVAADEYDTYDSCRSDPSCAFSNDIDELRGNVETADTISIVGFAVGGVATAVAIVLLIVGGGDDDAVAMEPTWLGVGGSERAVTVGWRF